VTSERWQQIEAIFREAVKLQGATRLSYLEQACRGDPGLRVEVESLLTNDRSRNMLDIPAINGLGFNDLDQAIDEWYLHPQPSPPVQPPTPQPPPYDDGRTVGPLPQARDFDPVVGWLVCVKGASAGRDYRIRGERNRIGRDSRMDICIAGDNRISRENHAMITFDPRNNQFRLSPGQSRGIVYLNGSLVDTSISLEPYDTIELGQTSLQFVPLCGERFQWR